MPTISDNQAQIIDEMFTLFRESSYFDRFNQCRMITNQDYGNKMVAMINAYKEAERQYKQCPI
jgi:hypothetical protein